MKTRNSGILMHISSLPGTYGIGCFGEEAKRFIDFLAETGCTYWQVLPFGSTDDYNSPYASVSAFAGNINFIDLRQLENLLTPAELEAQRCNNPYSADYGHLKHNRTNVLYQAYLRADGTLLAAATEYALENSGWLSDYSLYVMIKEAQGGKPWFEWEDKYKFRDFAALEEVKEKYSDAVRFIEFCQYIFDFQWRKIRKYAAEKGISIIGDMPIYVSLDSADVWSNRNLFDLNKDGFANNVAGVPPDYFAKDGQKWGQALYRWDVMKKDNYNWWTFRLRKTFELFDVVRIDHFRAFSAYWAVPADSPTAKTGKWIDGPGYDFFETIFKHFSKERIIAEDLGEIDDRVRELLAKTELPGMRVMQFGFLDFSDNLHLPHNYPRNSFAYTGTHDNNTVLGWLWEANPQQRGWAMEYCGFNGSDWAQGGSKSESVAAMINTLWRSSAKTVIVPIQDLLGYGGDTRMNTPGVADGNWMFRITREQLEEIDAEKLKEMNRIFMR